MSAAGRKIIYIYHDAAEKLGANIAIGVAEGTFRPINDMGEDNTYKEAKSCSSIKAALFGHFAGTETSPNQRNLADPSLSGF